MSSNKNNLPARRRPVKRPSSASAKNHSRRVHRLSLALSSRRRLVISLRKFRTNPSRHSKQSRKFVIHTNIFRIREVSLAVTSRKRSSARRALAAGSAGRPPRKLQTAAAAVLVAVGLGSAVFFGANLQRPVDFAPAHSAKVLAAPRTAKVMSASVPVRLTIPKIGVDTQLSQVGLQSNGQMEMPWDIETASWYKYSPTPGQLGPSIIVGHLDGANYANMAGIFYRLHELVPGDQFSVTRTDGSIANFKVLYLEQVPQNNFPTQEIYGNINYAGIRLITCGGTFDQSSGHYNDNTVVFATLE